MKLTCISDTHGRHELITVPDADMILHAGDCTNTGTTEQIIEFCEWYGKLPHKYKVLIAGNHDWGFERDKDKHQKICEDNGIIYLQDSGCEIEGIKIWGSPQTPEFCDWAFNCWRSQRIADLAYYNRYDFIGKYWDMIPEDTDILLTHGPPYDILDKCRSGHVGCELLAKKIEDSGIKYHIFGHIHEGRGEFFDGVTKYINAASLDGEYQPRCIENGVYEYK